MVSLTQKVHEGLAGSVLEKLLEEIGLFPQFLPQGGSSQEHLPPAPKRFPFTAELHWATCSVLSLLEAEQVLRGRGGGTESC